MLRHAWQLAPGQSLLFRTQNFKKIQTFLGIRYDTSRHRTALVGGISGDELLCELLVCSRPKRILDEEQRKLLYADAQCRIPKWRESQSCGYSESMMYILYIVRVPLQHNRCSLVEVRVNSQTSWGTIISADWSDWLTMNTTSGGVYHAPQPSPPHR